MIEQILPLSEKKMRILKYIYENQPTHLRKISAELGIHPYLVKKNLDSLASKKILEQQQAGRTILVKINKLLEGIEQLEYFIESYKQKTERKILGQIIKGLQQFSKNRDILSCILFGSYAREAETKTSDVDVLFVIKNKMVKSEIVRKFSQLKMLTNLDFSPIIMMEDEFQKTIEAKEPATLTLLKPSQRIIIFGIEYFLRME